MKCCFIPLGNGKKRLQWDITYTCNMKCLHCCASENRKEYPYNEEDILRVIDTLRRNNIGKVSISGGEPTMSRHFKYIIKMLWESHFLVGIISNLYYDIDDKLKDSLGYINNITTSIDGTRDIHNRIRGVDCFDDTIHNIERLCEMGKKVKVIMTVHDGNIKCLDTTVEMLKNIGVEKLMLAKITAVGRALVNKEKLKLTIDDISFENEVNRLIEKYNYEIITSECSFIKIENRNNCLAAKEIFHLDSNLNLHPCHLNQEFGINIFEPNAFEYVSEIIKH